MNPVRSQSRCIHLVAKGKKKTPHFCICILSIQNILSVHSEYVFIFDYIPSERQSGITSRVYYHLVSSVPRRGSKSTAPDQDKALIENEWMNDFHVLVSVVLWSIVLLMACLKSLIGFYLTKTLWIKAFDKWANILKCTWVEILPLHALIIDNKLDVLYMHSHSTND